MQSDRCRHYQLETELIAVPGAPVLLRIPVRRCHLAEHMIARLTASEHGEEIAGKLMFPLPAPAEASLPIRSDREAGERPESDVEAVLIRAVFGPDLEPIHHADCLVQRCVSSCTPAYTTLLEQFGLTVDVNHATGRGCQEATEITEDAR